MALDLIVVAVLGFAAVAGALSGALRQLVSLLAIAAGTVAARLLGPAVAGGLAGSLGGPLARAAGPLVLFLGTAAAVSLAGGLILRASGLSRAVRSPADRGAGALLGGAKGALAAWVLLSALALALAWEGVPGRVASRTRGSELLDLARAHNLLVRLDPGATQAVERAIAAARGAQLADALSRDRDSARLLADPRVRGLVDSGAPPGDLDPAEVARVLEDPEIRALVERLAGRAAPALARER